MKVRINYVSNSSSSSCLIACKPLSKLKDLVVSTLKKDRTYFILGDWLSEGMDCMEFTAESSLLKLIMNNLDKIDEDILDSTVYEMIRQSCDSDELDIDAFALVRENNPKVTILYVHADYHSTEYEDDFKRRYFKED